MAESTFTLKLVTPQRKLLESEAVALQVPGSEGYLGILAHHAPLITTLQPGRLDVRVPGGTSRSFAVSGGFLEVSGNRATVLADSAERIEEIDRARAESSLKRAEQRLEAAGSGDSSVDRARALRSLARAKNRLAWVSAART